MSSIDRFIVKKKEITLHHSHEEGSPLIVFNNFEGDGSSIMDAARQLGSKAFNLLCIGNLNWNHDMSPWHCPPLFPQDTQYTGGADEHLKLVLEEILPEGLRRVSGTPSHISIAGYSLAGLFAIYAMYHTDVFSRAASMSGSLWFPDFKEYVFSHEMKRMPQKLYLSLGDREARTRNQYMRTVQEKTESIVEHYKAEGIDVVWELNPGNHFKDAKLRCAKGIAAIV